MIKKISFFIFTLLRILYGVLLIFFGEKYLDKELIERKLLKDVGINKDADMNIPLTLMVVGLLIFFMSIFGYCGFKRKSKCILKTYLVFLLVSFIKITIICIFVVIYINQNLLIYITLILFVFELLSVIFIFYIVSKMNSRRESL